jgi:hypothetical protein
MVRDLMWRFVMTYDWIEHDGFDIPVNPDVKVLVWQGGETEEAANSNDFVATSGWWHGNGGEESNWVWEDRNDPDGIVKYRIVE